MFQHSMTAILVLFLTSSIGGAEQKRPQTPYGTLHAEWKAEIKALDIDPERSTADKVAAKKQINTRYTTRFLELAREHLDNDLWLECLIWTSVHGISGPDFDRMFDLLRTNAAKVRNTTQLQLLMSEFIPLRSDRLNAALEHITTTHPDFGVRGAALYALAARTKRIAEEHGDSAGLATATKLLEQVVADYPKVGTYRGTNSENASELLEEIRSPVAISKPVPKTTGKLVTGDAFELLPTIEEKVAVIAFSGHWCGPCVAMHPVQKEILRRFPDNVVVIEINSDALDSVEKVCEKLAADGLDWTVVADGNQGPISEQWQVTSWPTYFVVDVKGRIRHRVTGNLGNHLITLVQGLLPEHNRK